MPHPFHFENVISNLLDNAIQIPDGEKITISLDQNGLNKILRISDNAREPTSDQKKRVFEQFYRVPKRLILHDVKGFWNRTLLCQKNHGKA